MHLCRFSCYAFARGMNVLEDGQVEETGEGEFKHDYVLFKFNAHCPVWWTLLDQLKV